MEPMQRRLLAIMVADVVGYSRLIEGDEAGTLAALQGCLAGTVRPSLVEHRGRLVKNMGDGFIAEFGSVVDAVTCAVALQRRVAVEQSERTAGQRLVFRIGINLGDVVIDNDDLLGDGIIVAARLEALCEPGGVLISGTAFDQLQGKMGLPIEYAGEQRVKNIARPVRTYRVRLDGKRSWWPRLRLKLPPPRFAVPALVLILLFAVATWWWMPDEKGREKPGIAVLPFEDLDGDPVTARLASGITEDVITDFARYRGFDVIARNSVKQYTRPVDVRAVGKALNVNYVLQGSVRRQDDQIRVSAELSNVQSGAVTWSERWDRPMGDFFAIQSELSGQVATRLGRLSGTVFNADREVTRRKPPNSLTAYDLYLLGMEAQGRATQAGIGEAIGLFKRSLSIDPGLSRAWTNLSWAYQQRHNWQESTPDLERLEHEAALRAVELDPLDGNAHAALAEAYANTHETAQTEAEYERALELNPNSADILAS